jgi:hypothetical protein
MAIANPIATNVGMTIQETIWAIFVMVRAVGLHLRYSRFLDTNQYRLASKPHLLHTMPSLYSNLHRQFAQIGIISSAIATQLPHFSRGLRTQPTEISPYTQPNLLDGQCQPKSLASKNSASGRNSAERSDYVRLVISMRGAAHAIVSLIARDKVSILQSSFERNNKRFACNSKRQSSKSPEFTSLYLSIPLPYSIVSAPNGWATLATGVLPQTHR